MKKLFLFSLLCLFSFSAFAGIGDTIRIKTITFDSLPWNSTYNGTFMFPDDSVEYEKVLMYYTLKCDPATTQDNYDCGEWDYLTYTFVWDSSGTMDSTYRTGPNFQVGTTTPDSLAYTTTPTWNYYQDWQYWVTHTNPTSFDSAIVGTGTTADAMPFGSAESDGRGQYVWRASELTSAGLTAGNITGLRVNVNQVGSSLRNLTLRMKHTGLDTLSLDTFETGGFTTVYHLNTTLPGTGWQDLQFVTPFLWDGVSNIVIDFSFDNAAPGTNNLVLHSAPGFSCGVAGSATDAYLHFQQNGDYVNLGQGPQVTGVNPRTIEAWAYTEGFNNGGLFQAGTTGTTGRDFSLRTRGGTDNWRAQMWGTPDFDATLAGSANNWHHYALVYDGTTIFLYYDGVLAAQESFALDTWAKDIWIGRWSGNYFRGRIDEVRCWDAALSAQTLRDYMHAPLSPSHPNWANLTGHFPFDEGAGITTADASSQHPDADLYGLPDWVAIQGKDMFRNLATTTTRPNIIFEQGVYGTTTLDSTLHMDSTQKSPVMMTVYGNPAGGIIIPDDAPNHPSLPTDTLLVWEAGINCYTWDVNTGMAVDSQFIASDSIVYQNTKEWYSPIVRFEIERFITPYGIGLDLGPQGFTWVYDVTDYAPLFHGPVRLQSGNRQELLDLTFVLIEGTPPRDVRHIRNLYDGSFSYRGMADGDILTPLDIPLDPNAQGWRIKTRTSGHGFGSGENCAEFCRKRHWLDVDGVSEVFNWHVWKECATNPVYPQGGTWIYDRAGWCPGTETDTYNHELTDHVTAGDTVNIDYGVQGYPANGGNGNYVTRVQLVTYDAPNHTDDMTVERIIAPNNWDIYSKVNPICANPSVIIKNKGSNTVTSATIHYGVTGGASSSFNWTGSLPFLESETVELPLIDLFQTGSSNQFWARVEIPGDQYPTNDTLYSWFRAPRIFPNHFYLNIRTNGRAQETRYTLHDDQGNLLVQSSPFWAANSIYRDTFLLDKGCYVFRLYDTDEDGLEFFANNDGAGFARFFEVGGSGIYTFEPDFGKEVFIQMKIDTEVSIDEVGLDPFVKVFPNPTDGQVNIQYEFGMMRDVKVTVTSAMGQVVYEEHLGQVNWGRHPVDLSNASPGVYFVKVQSGDESTVKKIVLQE